MAPSETEETEVLPYDDEMGVNIFFAILESEAATHQCVLCGTCLCHCQCYNFYDEDEDVLEEDEID